MSIASEIERIISDKSSIKNAIESKDENITIGETERIDSYASYIEQIEGGVVGKLHSRYVVPSNVTQEVVPLSGYDGMSEVMVLGSSNLVPENIKKGVTIFGVTGTYEYVDPQVVHYLMFYDNTHIDEYYNQMPDVTGGWELTFTTNANYGKIEYSTSGVLVYASYSGGTKKAKIATAKTIDLTDYVKYAFRIDTKGSDLSAAHYHRQVGFTDSSSFLANGDYSTTNLIRTTFYGNQNNRYISGDIAAVEGGYYAFAMAASDQSKITSKILIKNAYLLMQDDWQTLCTKAGLVADDYEDDEDLCSNSTAMTTILSNQEAVNYMISNCTGTFMHAFTTSSTAMTAYESSPFKTTIRANEHWDKFITIRYSS